ncbi:hypothetical protein [Rhodopirellula europaea]|uniref:Uncharacterized protein n=1 Tax=Rhodopirellula europaea SH398 TaxID=1263868 RepID=M5SAH4_9BACT|nr:hypothetical protein [Rhodopirellula europaea]EMI28475.1 hypothetical protein RESH_00950 [Rhodopirellula europaea SH398]
MNTINCNNLAVGDQHSCAGLPFASGTFASHDWLDCISGERPYDPDGESWFITEIPVLPTDEVHDVHETFWSGTPDSGEDDQPFHLSFDDIEVAFTRTPAPDEVT